jgi:hypothetical protein
MSEISNEDIQKVIRWSARIIGLILTLFLLVLLIGGAVSEGITGESLYVIIPVIIAFTAYIAAWWREKIGGIVLMAAYVLLSLSPTVHSLVYDEVAQIYPGMWLFILPYLVAGVLFFISSQIFRQASA